MKLSRNIDVKSTTKLEVIDSDGVNIGVSLTVRDTFKGSEVSKILGALSDSGTYEAQDLCTTMLLKDWEGVTDDDDKEIELTFRYNLIETKLFETIPQIIKETVWNHFAEVQRLKNEEVKN